MSVRITGIGIVSATGLNVQENVQALKESISGIVPFSFSEGTQTFLAGTVKASDLALKKELGIADQYVSRTTLLGLKAAREAWGNANQHAEIRTGIVSATSVGGMDRSENFYHAYLNGTNPDFEILKTHDSGTTTEKIALELGISGYINTISTACSSGANAIMLGARLLMQDKLDRVLVGGADALTNFTVNGFRSLMIYDEQWCRPFDESRAGLNLGEGAAFLLLENEKSISFSGNKTLAFLNGWANAADAFHQTASSPEGKGATLAIQKAIEKSGISTAEISYINAHGTGTKNNDLSESVALKNVFADQMPAFSSTKSFTGHTLAAAGAIEAVFSILSIQHQLIYPTSNFESPITETGLEPVTILQTEKPVHAVLSNSFGFGGNNSSLVFSDHA